MAEVPVQNRYQALVASIFAAHHEPGITEFLFVRSEIKDHATKLGIVLPENLGDVIYAMRFRTPLPDSILKTQPAGREWVIELAGKGRYRFRLVPNTRIVPSPMMATIFVPDATPEVIRLYALDDEQALLAIVRYNRLIDTFLGLTTYSLQNHLRTAVKGIGQIEIDELYVGLDSHGCHFVIPVQAKGGKDQIGVVQTSQDIAFVAEKFPGLRCRAVSAQFLSNGSIALFELTIQHEEVRVVQEKHYRLVASHELEKAAVTAYVA